MSAQMALPLPLVEGDRVRWVYSSCDWGMCKGVGRVVKVYSVPDDSALRVLVRWGAAEIPTFAESMERA